MIGRGKVDTNLVSKYFDSNSISNQDFIAVLESVIKEYKAKEQIYKIPIQIFSNRKLGILEALVKYLKENATLPYHDIAKLLNRDDRTIWTTYNKAKRKDKEAFQSLDGDTINPDIFSNRNQAPLKALIMHLTDRGMTLKQISLTLNRSYKTIWLTYNKRKK